MPSTVKALARYRVMAYIVGTMLLVLTFFAFVWRKDVIVAVVGPLHGFLYIAYLLTVLDLAVRVRMNVIRMVLVMAAGTIPFLSFVAEHYLTRSLRSAHRV